MDIVQQLKTWDNAICCVDMHTTGEPTRIILSGYPQFSLNTTLLEQRQEAKTYHDHIRRKLVLEPRGHGDMYGAVLRPDTEHTRNGQAHMGVLFLTNDGYSTMCGHATIALGRFLIDTHDKDIFPQRDRVIFDTASKTAHLVLHAPCGLVEVTVPTNVDGSCSDPTRPVRHVSVPSFTTGLDVRIDLSEEYRWPELHGRDHVKADFSYGGAFYCFVSAAELGFCGGLAGKPNLSAMNVATRLLKTAVNNNPSLRHLFSHPDHTDLGFLYSIIVVDQNIGLPIAGARQAETGLCFFSDQQVDRSPTGSGVAARVALAHAKSKDFAQTPVTYHSLLSNHLHGRGGFNGTVHEETGSQNGWPIIRARIDGYASYAGTSSFVVEASDPIGDDGFLFDNLG